MVTAYAVAEIWWKTRISYILEGTHNTIHISADPDAIMAVEDEGPGITKAKCGKPAEVRADGQPLWWNWPYASSAASNLTDIRDSFSPAKPY